jgi:hypothetical protein
MEVPKVFFRNIEQQYAVAFVEEGEILFRPLSYYRKREDEKGDAFEGKILANGPGIKAEISSIDCTEKIGPIEILNLSLTLSETDSNNICVSCYSKIKNTRHLGSTIEIFDVPKFLAIVDAYLAKFSSELSYGHVYYYDSIQAPEFVENPRRWLYKRNLAEFVAEAEFRLGVNANLGHLPRGTDANLLLKLGTLVECAKVSS